MEELVIVGSNATSLTCLNALLEGKQNPLLIPVDVRQTPFNEGEWVSPPVMKQLQQWDIKPMPLRYAHFTSAKQESSFYFPELPGGIARSKLSAALKKRALEKGARIQDNFLAKIELPRHDLEDYRLTLSDNTVIEAKHLMVATDIFQKQIVQKSNYISIQFYIPHIPKYATLAMYSLPGMYMTIVPINMDLAQCSALIRRDKLNPSHSIKDNVMQWIHEDEALQKTFSQFEIETIDWVQSEGPFFQRKATPVWSRTMWVGETLGTLPPAVGGGYSHEIYSGLLASQYYLRNKSQQYQKFIRRHTCSRLFYGKLAHQVLLHPRVANQFSSVMAAPWATYLFCKKLGF